MLKYFLIFTGIALMGAAAGMLVLDGALGGLAMLVAVVFGLFAVVTLFFHVFFPEEKESEVFLTDRIEPQL
jgi:fatty acid desaturase